jgi:hypothetical protein
VLKGVKMQMRRRKDVEKAGGIEGLLVSLQVMRYRLKLTVSCQDPQST